MLEGTQNPDWDIIPAKVGRLPLPDYGIYMYVAEGSNVMLVKELVQSVRLLIGETKR